MIAAREGTTLSLQDRWRWLAVAGNAGFLLLDGPGELRDIIHGIAAPDQDFHWRLVLGLVIRNLLIAGTIIGLAANRRWGYVCLLTESIHAIIIRFGSFQAVLLPFDPPSVGQHVVLLILPTIDVLFRISCLGLAGQRWPRA